MIWAVAYLLIIDDDADAREVLSKYLGKVGHEVESASSGQQALGCVLARQPDLIILDICMPDLDGAGFLKALRSYLGVQSLPVVVFTGVPDSPLVERARMLRVGSVLVKGMATPQDVLHAVEEQLGGDREQLHRA
jgi:CheY-like chemotaxis protein